MTINQTAMIIYDIRYETYYKSNIYGETFDHQTLCKRRELVTFARFESCLPVDTQSCHDTFTHGKNLE